MEPTVFSGLLWWAEATALLLLGGLVCWYGLIPGIGLRGAMRARPVGRCVQRYLSLAGIVVVTLLVMLLGLYLVYAAAAGIDLGAAIGAWAVRYVPRAFGVLALGAALVAVLSAARNWFVGWVNSHQPLDPRWAW